MFFFCYLILSNWFLNLTVKSVTVVITGREWCTGLKDERLQVWLLAQCWSNHATFFTATSRLLSQRFQNQCRQFKKCEIQLKIIRVDTYDEYKNRHVLPVTLGWYLSGYGVWPVRPSTNSPFDKPAVHAATGTSGTKPWITKFKEVCTERKKRSIHT